MGCHIISQEHSAMAKVAFLGLGVMGYPMARHLKAKGHEVTVYNRTFAKAETWVSGCEDTCRGGKRAGHRLRVRRQ
jgi:glutamyl-tRNA reductase